MRFYHVQSIVTNIPIKTGTKKEKSYFIVVFQTIMMTLNNKIKDNKKRKFPSLNEN